MSFIENIKKKISKKIEYDRQFRAEVNQAAMQTKREQAIRIARQREIIRADATIAREKARFRTSPRNVFNTSIAPKKIACKINKSKKNPKSSNASMKNIIKKTSTGKFNPITGEGRAFI